MRPRVSRRPVVLVLAPALLTLLLSGCGGGAGSEAGTPTALPVPTLAAAPPTPRALTPTSAPTGTARATSSTSAPAAAAAPTSAPAATSSGEEKIYVVEAGDTLAVIAQKQYGDSSLWQKIYEANKDVIGNNPDSIQVGMKLKIPPKS